MSNLQDKQEKQKQQFKSQNKSGSQYHEEHAGNVTGYGEIDPNAEGVMNRTDNPSSSS